MIHLTLQPDQYLCVFLRHGESVGNADGHHQGQADFPLTAKGKAQARALANRWHTEQVRFDLIISSPLQRARETAEILAESLDYPLVFDPLWMERNNGLLAGLSHTEASIRYPRPEFINPYHHIAQTGESQWELYLRAGQAIQSLIDRSSGRYLIVSHGGILNMVCYVILGLTPQANFQGPWFRFRNTAFTTLTYSPDIHEWSVWGVNDRLHWSEED